MKIAAVNKSASFEYFIEEKFEAGIVLEGAEVKSLRLGKASLSESFCLVERGEVFLKNMHIALYDKSGAFSTRDSRKDFLKNMHIALYDKSGAFSTRDSRKDRKLLLHRTEIAKIAGKVNRSGYTLVPLKVYFKDALVKVEIALCRGKHTYDKKRSIAERDQKRAADREAKEYMS